MIWEGQIRLLADNDPATARRLGHEAAELGRALGDLDIEMTGRGLEGRAAVTAGDIGEGMAKLDEATATAVSGDMSEPIGIGATCCYLIFALRAGARLRPRRPVVRAASGALPPVAVGIHVATCRTHHAGVLLWQGAWKEAEAELEAATRELQASRPGKVADGILRLAELRRRQRRLEEAERVLKRVSFSPHALFGLAALALDRDQPADALDVVDRFVRQIPDENRTDRAAAFELAAHGAPPRRQPPEEDGRAVADRRGGARHPRKPPLTPDRGPSGPDEPLDWASDMALSGEVAAAAGA